MAAVGSLVAWYTAAVLEACYIIAVVLDGMLHNLVVLDGMLVVSRWWWWLQVELAGSQPPSF